MKLTIFAHGVILWVKCGAGDEGRTRMGGVLVQRSPADSKSAAFANFATPALLLRT